MSKGTLKILQLYPNEMNIYGDFGNVLTLKKRAEWHGYTAEIAYHHVSKKLPEDADIIIGGGGQDSGQSAVMRDLTANGEKLRDMSVDGLPMLMVCGLYQLFGHRFITSEQEEIQGISIFDMETIAGPKRLIGNIVTESYIFGEIIGYENHSGLTHLLGQQKPFARVKKGAGNNGQDKLEGALSDNTIGTYLHGSLLPKNPQIADFLIEVACMRKYGRFDPEIIADRIANRARDITRRRPR